MNNKNGFGLLGFLIAVLLMGILMSLVLKKYTRQVADSSAAFMEMQNMRPVEKGKPSVRPTAKPAPGAVPTHKACQGRLVGNICVPTKMHSSQEDFEKMNLGQ